MPEYATVACLEVPVGCRVIVVSDLFLGAKRTDASGAASLALAHVLRLAEGPGALVVAGNAFDLLVPADGDPAAALGAHEELRQALGDYLAADCCRRAIMLPGNRDRAILYDQVANAAVTAAGFEVAISAKLQVATAGGSKQVRIEAGWRFDERNAFVDPADQRDTPLGHHAVAEILPALAGATTSPWLDGIDRLADPSGLPRFVASRLTYRRVVRWLWWLLLPIAVALLARLPDPWLFGVPGRIEPFSSRLLGYGLTLVAEVVVAGIVLAVVNHRVWHSAGRSLLGPPAHRANDAAREAARPILEDGGVGLVTGHTLQPELTRVGTGFYANSGACGEVVEERASRLGLPPVFVHVQQVSWVEIEAGAQVHARLLLARSYLRPVTVLERFAAGRLPRSGSAPAVVASFPGGVVWPRVSDPARSLRRVRRLAAAGIALLGLTDLVSAVVPPQVRGRLHPLLGYIPLGVSEAAGALVALAGVGLIALARGVRRGQRSAWLVSIMLLAGTVALHLIRHGDVVQSIAALALVAVLWWARKSFRARFDLPSLQTGLTMLLVGVLGITCIGATVLWSVVPTHRGGRPITWIEAWWATAGRLVGIRRWPSTPAWTPFCTRPFSPSASGWPPSRSCSCSARSSTGAARAGAPTPPSAPPTSCAVAEWARSTTSPCAATSRCTSNATASSPMPSTAASASSRPTRSAPRRSVTSSGPPSVASRTTTAGRSLCSVRARNGWAPIADLACTSATSATRASSTCGPSPSRAARERASARR